MLVINQESNSSKYNIYVSRSFNDFNSTLDRYVTAKEKIFIITDNIVSDLYSTLISEIEVKYSSNTFIINNGEENKNYNTIEEIYKFLIENNADRNSFLIAIGGGVVGDLVGFAAATFMRGIKFVNIPTTLISQVDSSVGGKVGYNFSNLKNSIGCFYDPIFVYISTDFLSSLGKEQILNGMGEVIKYGLIINADLFNFIESNLENIIKFRSETLEHIISSCIEMKIKVVKEDYRDKGIRNILNFGHTVGHGLETSSDYKLPHGIAVALGMLVSVKLSERMLELSQEIYIRLENIYKKLGIPIRYKVDNYQSFLYAINHDKKNSNHINFVLLKDIENCKIKINVDEEILSWALENSIFKEE